jgi:hypothetical protein
MVTREPQLSNGHDLSAVLATLRGTRARLARRCREIFHSYNVLVWRCFKGFYDSENCHRNGCFNWICEATNGKARERGQYSNMLSPIPGIQCYVEAWQVSENTITASRVKPIGIQFQYYVETLCASYFTALSSRWIIQRRLRGWLMADKLGWIWKEGVVT